MLGFDHSYQVLSLTDDKPIPLEARLNDARSVTLIIHGIGKSSEGRLLTAAANGYDAFGGKGRLLTSKLDNCPALSGAKGVDALVIESENTSDVVIALPWSDSHTRISDVTLLCASTLLILTLLAGLTFLFRRPLDVLCTWLRSWTHFFIASLALGLVAWLIESESSKNKLHPRTWLWWPPLLQLFLFLFAEPFLLAGFISLPVFVLWLILAFTLVQCVRAASGLGWQTAAWILLIAISFSAATLIRVVLRTAYHAEEALASPHFTIPPNVWDDFEAESNRWLQEPTGPPTASEDARGPRSTVRNKPKSPETSTVDKEDIESAAHELTDGPLPSLQDPTIRDFVVSAGFKGAVTVSIIGIGLALLGGYFGWLLDFAFDIFFFAGKEKQRTSLIDNVTRTIRWCHDKAPNARLIVVGHSLGSVLAAVSISSLPPSESCLQRLLLVTLGSPLNYLCRVFPKSIPCARQLSLAVCPEIPWVNLWRSEDIIGKSLDIERTNTFQQCIGAGGHRDYWGASSTWDHVARYALGVFVTPQSQSKVTDTCVVERHLKALAFILVTTLYCLGVSFWIVGR